MTPATTIQIRKPKRFQPHRNLPHSKGGNGREDRFVRRFAQAYVMQFAALHPHSSEDTVAIAREIPANGFGIADCVAVSWSRSRLRQESTLVDTAAFVAQAKPTLRAFELKLNDWRRALRQANRYRFFAHIPIVVLPSNYAAAALKHLATFRLLGIGLWSFDPAESRIVIHYSPRRSRPHDQRHADRALGLVARVSSPHYS